VEKYACLRNVAPKPPNERRLVEAWEIGEWLGGWWVGGWLDGQVGGWVAWLV